MALFIYSCLAGVFVVYYVGLLIQRVYFHPLSKFPGPKLAAATGWYEAYFDLFVRPGGQFMMELQRLHQVYGPIVRINPHEIHVDDTAWLDTLYTGPAYGIRDKYPPAAYLTGTPRGIFGTVAFDLHRKRRGAISALFSKAQATQEEPIIYDKLDLLIERVNTQIARDGFAEMRANYLAFTTDTVADYCLEKCLNLLHDEKKALEWQETINALANTAPIARQWSWVTPLSLSMPVWLLNIGDPKLARIVGLHRTMEFQAKEAIKAHESGEKDDPRAKRNIFRTILANPSLPDVEKVYDRISQEGVVVIAAGGETTGRALATATFFLLENRTTLLPRLQEEIKSVMPKVDDRPAVKDLEKLPLLTAIIKETLRLNGLLTSRFPLISPQQPLQYKDWVIPAGTPVSMTLRDVLNDPEVFANPRTFDPDRWLNADSKKLEQMNTNFVPFGRGSRMCLGTNLAWAEMYIALASIFRRTNWDLYDTTREKDIDIIRDCFIGEVDKASKGVRVTAAQG